MEAIAFIVVPGLLGGLIFALVVLALQRRPGRQTQAVRRERLAPVSPDVINMSRIQVAGVGGLGFVAMAIAVALGVPQIGASVGIGLVSGVALAVIMIARQRRTGPMPSSGRQMGANVTLSIDSPGEAEAAESKPGGTGTLSLHLLKP